MNDLNSIDKYFLINYSQPETLEFYPLLLPRTNQSRKVEWRIETAAGPRNDPRPLRQRTPSLLVADWAWLSQEWQLGVAYVSKGVAEKRNMRAGSDSVVPGNPRQIPATVSSSADSPRVFPASFGLFRLSSARTSPLRVFPCPARRCSAVARPPPSPGNGRWWV